MLDRFEVEVMRRNLGVKQKDSKKEYIKQYMFSRYHSDPEFRNRIIKHVMAYQNRRRVRK